MKQIFESREWGATVGGAFTSCSGPELRSFSPTDHSLLATVVTIDKETYGKMIRAAREEFERWRMLPAPKRGEIVRQVGDVLRENKEPLGRLVSMEMGKILQEGLGEVQEAIDIADFAVGLSRQLYGLTTHSERPLHRMYEQWHPLGLNAVITAFNFPVAVWAWNAMLAAVCGNTLVWKPSSKTPLCAIAIQKLVYPVFRDAGFPGVMNVAVGSGSTLGEWLINDRRIPLVSATGSCRMGYRIGEVVGKRLGRHLLELGGNNALIVCESANLSNALQAVLFGAVGTAGQRCTSTRRLFLHSSVYDTFVEKLVSLYDQVNIGDPLDQKTLMGPLIDRGAIRDMQDALEKVREEGAEIIYGGEVLEEGAYGKGAFVKPCLVKAHHDLEIARDETFAPILYIYRFDTVDEAIELQNSVEQGLSSSIFTRDLIEAETFLSHRGSDCGIANVNLGTSGAEIGLAFGGEKETGGGREAGSDSWKAYMRRQTNTINWGPQMPLAQGIKFDLG